MKARKLAATAAIFALGLLISAPAWSYVICGFLDHRFQFRVYYFNSEFWVDMLVAESNKWNRVFPVLSIDRTKSSTIPAGKDGNNVIGCLGAVQGLARLGILGKFHYLSTVSGGGYLGSMLAAWAYRAPGGMADVEAGLVASRGTNNVGWLREYLSYLSPKRGLFGADTWTLLSTYIRNLLLNALVWFPLLAGVLTLPHLIVAAVDGIAGRWNGTPALDSLAG
jgi:hypothetical protein